MILANNLFLHFVLRTCCLILIPVATMLCPPTLLIKELRLNPPLMCVIRPSGKTRCLKRCSLKTTYTQHCGGFSYLASERGPIKDRYLTWWQHMALKLVVACSLSLCPVLCLSQTPSPSLCHTHTEKPLSLSSEVNTQKQTCHTKTVRSYHLCFAVLMNVRMFSYSTQ